MDKNRSSTRIHPAVWLVYLVFFVLGPIVAGDARELLRTATLLALFLPLYFWTCRRQGWVILPALALMVGFGYYGCQTNLGAANFFVYSAALAARLGTRQRTLLWLGVVLVVQASTTLYLGPLTLYMVPMLVITVLIAFLCLHQETVEQKNEELRQSREEVTRLAKIAERERIARDLHDLLGHSLSLVVLKSQLAGRLLRREGVNEESRAATEIAELEKIARQALQEVRTAVAGWKSAGLLAEIASGAMACEAAGQRFERDGVAAETLAELPPLLEGAMAMALREAITNVLRHAEATTCRVRLETTADLFRLEIEDDGRGLPSVPGLGGQGMSNIRQRVAQLGGEATWLSAPGGGTLVRLELPRQGQGDFENLTGPRPVAA